MRRLAPASRPRLRGGQLPDKSWKRLDCAPRTRARPSRRLGARTRCWSASRWAAPSRSGPRPPGVGRWSASRRGSPTGSTSRRSRPEARRLPRSLDRYLPGLPASSQRARAQATSARGAAGIDATYTLIPRAPHGDRGPRRGAAGPLPRARPWARRRVGGRDLAESAEAAAARAAWRRAPYVPDEPDPPSRGSPTRRCRSGSGRGRAAPRRGRRGGCCASPRRTRAPRRASCCGLVARGVVPPAEHVADRVHAERHVLVEEDADEAAPDQPLRARPASVPPIA